MITYLGYVQSAHWNWEVDSFEIFNYKQCVIYFANWMSVPTLNVLDLYEFRFCRHQKLKVNTFSILTNICRDQRYDVLVFFLRSIKLCNLFLRNVLYDMNETYIFELIFIFTFHHYRSCEKTIQVHEQ